MRKKILLVLFLTSFFMQGFLESMGNDRDNFYKSRFVPPKGKILLVIGQDTGSISEYVKATKEVPAGFMTYTALHDVSGLYSFYDPGTNNTQHADFLISKKVWDNTIVQIGLYMNNITEPNAGRGVLEGIADGKYDDEIDTLSRWIIDAKRPVYLRIGYEFDGQHNEYLPEDYVESYKYVVDRMRKNSVFNAAFVWHSWGECPFGNFALSEWYPGDEYVDWVGISIFKQFQEEDRDAVGYMDAVCDFAREHSKPVMIAESTPFGGFPERSWADWFKLVFEYIKENNIKMFSYINADWESQSMWRGQGWGDCRIQQNSKIKSLWLKEISRDKYLKRNDNFIDELIDY